MARKFLFLGAALLLLQFTSCSSTGGGTTASSDEAAAAQVTDIDSVTEFSTVLDQAVVNGLSQNAVAGKIGIRPNLGEIGEFSRMGCEFAAAHAQLDAAARQADADTCIMQQINAANPEFEFPTSAGSTCFQFDFSGLIEEGEGEGEGEGDDEHGPGTFDVRVVLTYDGADTRALNVCEDDGEGYVRVHEFVAVNSADGASGTSVDHHCEFPDDFHFPGDEEIDEDLLNEDGKACFKHKLIYTNNAGEVSITGNISDIFFQGQQSFVGTEDANGAKTNTITAVGTGRDPFGGGVFTHRMYAKADDSSGCGKVTFGGTYIPVTDVNECNEIGIPPGECGNCFPTEENPMFHPPTDGVCEAGGFDGEVQCWEFGDFFEVSQDFEFPATTIIESEEGFCFDVVSETDLSEQPDSIDTAFVSTVSCECDDPILITPDFDFDACEELIQAAGNQELFDLCHNLQGQEDIEP